MKHHKTCFVIMPFGEKLDVDGQIVDFDKIYQYIIKQAVDSVESQDIHCIRCDEIEESGWIHADMFEKILESDIAIVDITSLNANVFYELGIRHALSDAITILIRKRGTHAPFNIQGLRVIDYDPIDLASVDKAKRQISSFIQNGLRYTTIDSPIHQALEHRFSVETNPEPIVESSHYVYCSPQIPNKKLCLVTGDIRDIKCADVWVNSENSNMQMDRYYNSSISSIVRYMGAEKDEAGYVIQDLIAEELSQVMNGRDSVPPGHILVTNSGKLLRTHNVKKIFHAASIIVAIDQGYSPMKRINRCITNALNQIESFRDESLQSILFPLMGAGSSKRDLLTTAPILLKAATSYLASNSDSPVETIYFLTYTQEELEICRSCLEYDPQLEFELEIQQDI